MCVAGPISLSCVVLAPTSRHAAASKLKWKVSGSASTEFSAAGPNVPPTRQTMYNSDTPGPKFSRRLTRHNCHNVFTALKSYNKQGTHFYALVITLRTFVLHRSMVSKIAAMWGDVSRSPNSCEVLRLATKRSDIQDWSDKETINIFWENFNGGICSCYEWRRRWRDGSAVWVCEPLVVFINSYFDTVMKVPASAFKHFILLNR